MKIFYIILLLLFSNNSNAQSINRKIEYYNLTNGLMNQGYDLVSYFELNKAEKGNPSVKYTSMGVTYYFSSNAHREKFILNPIKYEPQYGGWCAYAMGYSGEKVEVDPNTFKIYQGKLYLFYHTWVNNTLNKWNTDQTNLKIAADKNWALTIK
jgi:YHS domain-containing protein